MKMNTPAAKDLKTSTVEPLKETIEIRPLVLRANTNASLLHFVDFASQWHFRTHADTRRYFEREYGITDADRKMFDQYASVRHDFGHPAETELLQWAYEGFPDHPKFTQLRSAIDYFAQRSNGQRTVRQEMESHDKNIAEWIEKLNKEIHEVHLDRVVVQMQRLFDRPHASEPAVVAYLVAGVNDSVRGGANGEGIYMEIQKSDRQNPIQVLAHEYLHKVVSASVYYQAPEFSDFWPEVTNIYRASYLDFIEEVITYAVTNVIMFGQNPERTRAMWSELIDDLADRERMILLWNTIEKAVPILRNYLDDKTDIATTRGKLENLFRTVLNDTRQTTQ